MCLPVVVVFFFSPLLLLLWSRDTQPTSWIRIERREGEESICMTPSIYWTSYTYAAASLFLSVVSHQFAWQRSLFLHLFSNPPSPHSQWVDVSQVNIFHQNNILILAVATVDSFKQIIRSKERERERERGAVEGERERNGSGRCEPHFLLSTPPQQPLDTSGCDVLLPKFPFASVYTSQHFGAKIVN